VLSISCVFAPAALADAVAPVALSRIPVICPGLAGAQFLAAAASVEPQATSG
jgi:hypothetical protein